MSIFKDQIILIEDKKYVLPYRIRDAFFSDGNAIVLFQPSEEKERGVCFHNLRCYNREGDEIWTAELPTNEGMDRYYKISSQAPLVAYSVCSFACEIDIATGKIKTKTFFK